MVLFFYVLIFLSRYLSFSLNFLKYFHTFHDNSTEIFVVHVTTCTNICMFFFALFQSEVKLYVNRLNTEESVIPYEYHHFDFCPTDEANSPVENLGQVVFGERIRPGPYKIDFLQDVQCKKVRLIRAEMIVVTKFNINSLQCDCLVGMHSYV